MHQCVKRILDKGCINPQFEEITLYYIKEVTSKLFAKIQRPYIGMDGMEKGPDLTYIIVSERINTLLEFNNLKESR